MTEGADSGRHKRKLIEKRRVPSILSNPSTMSSKRPSVDGTFTEVIIAPYEINYERKNVQNFGSYGCCRSLPVCMSFWSQYLHRNIRFRIVPSESFDFRFLFRYVIHN